MSELETGEVQKAAAKPAPRRSKPSRKPAQRRKQTHTDETKVQQVADIILKDGTLATGGVAVESTGGSINKTYFDELAFMEEEIEILVHETSDENAENPVIVGNNGTFKLFFRGQPTVAKRKFVDSLIVKTGRVSTPEFINGAGERARAIRQLSAHKFSFSVIQDRNPNGAAWLRNRLAEPY